MRHRSRKDRINDGVLDPKDRQFTGMQDKDLEADFYSPEELKDQDTEIPEETIKQLGGTGLSEPDQRNT